MASRKSDVIVGITVLLAAAILIVGILWLKNFRVARHTYTLNVAFPQVGGLSKGDPVQVNGVAAGSVDHVELVGDSVLAVLSLDRTARVGGDARVVVRDQGMMGQKFVLIRTQHTTPSLPDGAHLSGYFDAGVGEVMALSGAMIENMQGLTAQIQSLLHSGADGHDLERMIRNMTELTTQMRAMATENRSDLRAVTVNMKSSSAQVDKLLRENGEQVGTTLRTAAATAAHMDSLATQLESLSASLQKVSDQVASGKGTVGQMVYDDSLYTTLNTTIRDASTLVQDMLKHPKKYFKISVF